MPCPEAVERTREILDIPAERRSCKELLTDGKLRPSSLWRWSTLNRSREPYPLVQDFVSYAWTRRCFRVLGFKMRILPPITNVEHRFAVTSMSNATVNLPGVAAALKTYKDDLAKKRAMLKRSKSGSKSKGDGVETVEHIYTSSPDNSPAKKKAKRDSLVTLGKKVATSSKAVLSDPIVDTTSAGAPSALSSFLEPADFLRKSKGYLLADDDSFLKDKKTEEVFDTTILSTFQV